MTRRVDRLTKKIIKDMPYFQTMFQNKEMAKAITQELELTKEEVDWLRK